MPDAPESKIDSAAKRVTAAVMGLVIGLVAGLFLVGFGDPLLATIGVSGVLFAVLGWIYPPPFLFVAGLLLSIIGVEV